MAEVRAIRAQRDTVAPSMFYGYAKAAWASRLKLHKSSGRAYVNHKGRRVYFGTANTPESRERFARFCDNPAAYLEEQAARYTHVPITRALAAVRKLLRGIERTLNTETEGGGS